MAVKFVFFDAGGVLFHYQDGLREIAARHQLQYDDFKRVYKKYDTQLVKGLMSAQQLWDYYQSELGFQEPGINYFEYWASKLTPIIETHAFVSELISSNIPVGLITNLYTGVLQQAVKHGNIPDVPYTAVVESSALHMKKPEPDIYLYAQEQSSTKPENILFIDDKPEFLEPAQNLGWQTFLFEESNPTNSISRLRQIILT